MPSGYVNNYPESSNMLSLITYILNKGNHKIKVKLKTTHGPLEKEFPIAGDAIIKTTGYGNAIDKTLEIFFIINKKELELEPVQTFIQSIDIPLYFTDEEINNLNPSLYSISSFAMNSIFNNVWDSVQNSNLKYSYNLKTFPLDGVRLENVESVGDKLKISIKN